MRPINALSYSFFAALAFTVFTALFLVAFAGIILGERIIHHRSQSFPEPNAASTVNYDPLVEDDVRDSGSLPGMPSPTVVHQTATIEVQ
jgi:hypothetical protein